MKKILLIIGGIVLLAIAAGGGFEGGMTYQRNQSTNIRNQFLQARGLDTNGGGFTGNFGNGQRTGQGGSEFGGGATGQVKDIQGNTIQLSTATNVTTVNLTSSTLIEKTISGTTADIQPGDRIIVRGQRDANGNITADQITIQNNLPAPRITPTP